MQVCGHIATVVSYKSVIHAMIHNYVYLHVHIIYYITTNRKDVQRSIQQVNTVRRRWLSYC